MSKPVSFNVTYDPDADVLYLSTKALPAARGIEDRYGFVWRYDFDGDLIGLTVVDFKDFWHSKRTFLADEIASHFDVSSEHARVILDHAMERRAVPKS